MSKRLTTEEFIERAKKIHGEKYDYSLVQYKNAKTKVKIICPVHGIFEQITSYHLNGKGCPKCGMLLRSNKRRNTTQYFIDHARNTHGEKYDYSLVQYKNAKTKVNIICPKHGVFEQIPRYHIKGQGCPECAGNIKLTTEEFIERARKVHGDKYDYSLVQYKNNKTKIKIICPIHGIFKQLSNSHLKGSGCPECAGNIKTNTQQFINRARKVQGNKYDYSLVQYKNAKTKIKIICPVHGIFEQESDSHMRGNGCPKCTGRYEKQYAKNNIPLYNTYVRQLEPYGVKCRRNKADNNILEVKCMYCNRWHIPSLNSVKNKIQTINGKQSGESNLYCSNECKHACPTYGQKLYPKGYKINTSREVQPALRKMVFERDGYTCQRCFATNVELHCHHYEGIEVNPIESADMDNCITLCKTCHNEIHKLDKCGIKDYKREECR